MFQVKYKFGFSAAHHLPDYDGPCKEIHGHDYGVEVVVAAEKLDSQGMVTDFHKLEGLVKQHILGQLDHTDLNESLPDSAQPPTAENIAKWIYDRLANLFDSRWQRLTQVTVEETPGCSAVYSKSEC